MPVKQALELEKIDAQAQARTAKQRAEDAAEAARDAARQESIDALKQEAQMLKAARNDVLAVLGMALELVPAMREVAKIIAEALQRDPVTNKRTHAFSPKEAMGLLSKHAQIVQKAVGSAEAVIQLSRLDRGESTVNVGVVQGEEMSYEDAISEFERLTEAMQGAKPGLLGAGREH